MSAAAGRSQSVALSAWEGYTVGIAGTTVLWSPIEPAVHPDRRQWERGMLAWIDRFGAGRFVSIIAEELAGRMILVATDPRGAQFSSDGLMWFRLR